MANIEEIEKKVGQLFFVGIPGTGFDSEAMHTCIRVGVGGIILFKHNYESVEQLVNLTSAIQKNMIPSSYKGLPAWIGVDQEGGRVQRFKDPFTILPPQDVWTKVGSPKACFEAGFVLGIPCILFIFLGITFTVTFEYAGNEIKNSFLGKE